MMHEFALRAYLGEMAYQCELAMRAFHDLQRSLRNVDVDGSFASAHAVLTHAGNVSRLLWPGATRSARARERADSRAAELRSILDLGLDHPLADRRFRDHLEHFDERMDSWVASTGGRVYVDKNIMPRAALGPFAEHLLRHIEPPSTFIFRDEEFDLGRLTQDLADLRGRIDRTLQVRNKKSTTGPPGESS